MADSNNDDPARDQSKRCAQENENPFVSFRRFADEQVNSLVNTIFSLPSAFNASFTERHRCPWKDEHRRRECEAHRREEPDDEHDDEFGPFERMFRDMEEAVEKETKEFEEIWKNADNAKAKENNGQRQPHEPRVYYWTWSWPPKSVEDTEREKDEFQKEMASRPESCKRRWEHSEHPWGPFGHRRRMYRDNDLYDQWQDYLLHDTYSPLQLESSESLGADRANWRYAYEDLLSETVQSASAFSKGRLYYASDRDRSIMSPQQWIEHLQRRHASVWWNTSHTRFPQFRGLSPFDVERSQNPQGTESQHIRDDDRKQIAWGNDTQQAEGQPVDRLLYQNTVDEKHSEPQTELDMYERFLGSSSQSSSAPSSSRPSILSTLTTTERTVQADGTVTTKVVLKKRFADGREESSETIHTAKADKTQLEDLKNGFSAVDEKPMKAAEGSKDAGAKRSGWFWSS